MQEQLADAFRQYSNAQNFPFAPSTLYDPVNYIMGLGGKQIRPQLCLLACHLFSDAPEAALPQAYAIELFHNFSLVHDDIMDEAPLRRGHDTVHKKFGLNPAILSGDVMLIHCYQYVTQGLTAAKASRAVELFSETAIDICRGQQNDLDFEQQSDPSMGAYLKMIEDKTAVLLGCSLALGGLVAGQRNRVQQMLYDIGVGMGMAFQIQDDLLDAFGSSAKTGKVAGGDIIQGKKTFLYLKAIEIGGPRVEAELRSLYADERMVKEQKVSRVLEIFGSLGVDRFGQTLKQKYYDRADAWLEALAEKTDRVDVLRELFSGLLNREA